MAEMFLDVLLDALIDTLKIIPFLYAVYLLIEYTEHRHSEKLSRALGRLGPFGSLGGALLGSIPQCGFSAAAANLYSGKMISAGTLIAVFIATSDEAIPMLIAEPRFAGVLWKLILIKIAVGFVTGLVVDLVLRRKRSEQSPDFEQICRHCDCEHHHIAVSALIHTAQISLFIFVISLILGGAVELAGAEAIGKIMMKGSPLQPFAAALFGFIPNCASSVVITELYMQGVLSFGSCIAGLSTGAGVGLLILFKTNRSLRENLLITAVMYAAAVVAGIAINSL